MKLERNELVKPCRFPLNQELAGNEDQYQKELTGRLDTKELENMHIDQMNERITSCIQTSLRIIRFINGENYEGQINTKYSPTNGRVFDYNF